MNPYKPQPPLLLALLRHSTAHIYHHTLRFVAPCCTGVQCIYTQFCTQMYITIHTAGVIIKLHVTLFIAHTRYRQFTTQSKPKSIHLRRERCHYCCMHTHRITTIVTISLLFTVHGNILLLRRTQYTCVHTIPSKSSFYICKKHHGD